MLGVRQRKPGGTGVKTRHQTEESRLRIGDVQEYHSRIAKRCYTVMGRNRMETLERIGAGGQRSSCYSAEEDEC